MKSVYVYMLQSWTLIGGLSRAIQYVTVDRNEKFMALCSYNHFVGTKFKRDFQLGR